MWGKKKDDPTTGVGGRQDSAINCGAEYKIGAPGWGGLAMTDDPGRFDLVLGVCGAQSI